MVKHAECLNFYIVLCILIHVQKDFFKLNSTLRTHDLVWLLHTKQKQMQLCQEFDCIA